MAAYGSTETQLYQKPVSFLTFVCLGIQTESKIGGVRIFEVYFIAMSLRTEFSFPCTLHWRLIGSYQQAIVWWHMRCKLDVLRKLFRLYVG